MRQGSSFQLMPKWKIIRKIQQREPPVTIAIGFIDGLSIPVECSDDVEEQAKIIMVTITTQ